MLLTPTKKYIFEYSAACHYYDLLKNFHEYFIDDLLMSGVGICGESMSDIFFDENDKYDSIFHNIIKKGVDYGYPSAKSQLWKENILESECVFYDFGRGDGVKYIYMLQNTMNWTHSFDFNCSVFSLIEPDIDIIDNYWRS
ncbi:MAG: hypothetical protein CL833_05840 [Crocinitomicaceae bacterium]|nr:hypothetical protein [Crocinitomicaceae bacterium]|tara:strand:- start:1171 stop:1593 length:423 start_codon:yes stop_codon:yes gene_type:complete